MKKSLLALAVLGAFAGAASAQSSVTLYGTMDIGLVRQAGVPWRLDSGNGISQLGFRGVEDLGGGMSAIFDLRTRFSPESGGADGSTNGRPFWQSISAGGLQGGFGKVLVGRQLTTFQGPINSTDPWGTEQVASTAILVSGYATDPLDPRNSAGLGRADVISYWTPSLGGFGVAASVGPKRTNVTGTGTTRANALVSLWASYGAGPLYVGFGTERNREGDKVVAGLASYDLGVVKLMGGVAQVDTLALVGKKGQNFNVGVTAPVGPFLLKFGFARAKAELAAAATTVQPVTVQKVGIGADYILSKRTNLYTSYAQDSKAATGSSAKKGLDFGIKHNF